MARCQFAYRCDTVSYRIRDLYGQCKKKKTKSEIDIKIPYNTESVKSTHRMTCKTAVYLDRVNKDTSKVISKIVYFVPRTFD